MNLHAPLPGGSARREGEALPTSVIKIMEGALHAIARRGAKRLCGRAR